MGRWFRTVGCCSRLALSGRHGLYYILHSDGTEAEQKSFRSMYAPTQTPSRGCTCTNYHNKFNSIHYF